MNHHFDVAIIGAGITGLTAAVLLKNRGKKVAVIEKERAGAGESGRSTAHVTAAIDARYANVARHFDKDSARLVASTLRGAIDQIESFVRELRIDCHFRRLPGYLYTEKRSHIGEVKREAQAAAEAGLSVKFVDEAPLPFLTRAAARFENQAQMSPREYLAGLAAQLRDAIFENTRVVNVREGEPCVVECESASFTADAVFMATHVPIAGFQSLHFKDESYRTYVLAFAATSDHPDGLFWDTADPYHYTRWIETTEGTLMLVGGEDHKVGQERDAEESFARLQEYTASLWSPQPLRDRWSGQILEPVDGLPYIGRSGKLYVSTGYAGQGTTFGTAGAMIVADLITGVANEAAELFDWKRIHLRGATKELVKHGLDFDRHIATTLTPLDVEAFRTFDVKSGEGKIVLLDGRKVAVARDHGGALHAVSPACRHMKCDVAWNNAEKTWDCPCHGSRYSIDGKVLNGPASEDLERVDVPQD